MSCSRSRACAHCGRGDAKAKCGNCSQVAYCGKECQRAAWKEHKLSGYCVPHCNICAGPTRNPCKTLPCKHKICGLCYDECKRLGCGGYCAKCDKFHLPSHPDDEGDRAMRCGALKDFLVAERMDRTIRERSRTMGMTKDESQRFAAWLRSGTNRCDVALEQDPADQHVHCVLGMIKRSQGDAVNAAASFGNCLEIEPSHPAANFYMGLIAMKNGDHCAATRRFQHAIKSDKSHAVWKSTAGSGRPDQTSKFSSSVKSKSIRLILGRIDCSRRVLEAQRKCLGQTVRLRPH